MVAAIDEREFDIDELFALGRLALEKNDVEGALRKLKLVVRDPKAPADAIALAARVYAQLRLFDRAERLYQRYLEKHPNALLERFQLGMTRFDAGQVSQALEIWEEVLQMQPDHPPTLFYKGLAFSQTGKVIEAKAILERLLKSASADNLYFRRTKELLQAIEGANGVEAAGNKGGSEAVTPVAALAASPRAYRSEH